MTNLAGFFIRYGKTKSKLDSSIKIATVGLSSYVVDNLKAGTYYFSVTSFASTGVESDLSAIVSKTI